MQGNETKTYIAQDVEVTGSVKCTSAIQVDGTLKGDLDCGGNAILGPTAQVTGNLSVDSVTVLGQVNGNITARDRIELKASTRMNGDIKSKRLTVEDGVTFIGRAEVTPGGGAGGAGVKPAAHTPGVAAEPAAEVPPTDAERDSRNRASGFFGRK